MFRKVCGFTLIELTMVIVILGVLSSIAIPKFIDIASHAKESATKSSLGTIRSALSISYAQSAVTGGSPVYPNPLTGSMFTSNTIPVDAFFNVNSVTTSINNPIAPGDFTDTGGWVYNSSTGEIRANVPGGHSW